MYYNKLYTILSLFQYPTLYIHLIIILNYTRFYHFFTMLVAIWFTSHYNTTSTSPEVFDREHCDVLRVTRANVKKRKYTDKLLNFYVRNMCNIKISNEEG